MPKISYLKNLLTIIVSSVITCFLLTPSYVIAASPIGETIDNYQTVRFPAGTLIKGILQHNLSTARNNTADQFILTIPNDIQIGDLVCIPKDSKLIGTIARLGRAQPGKNGFIEIIINTIRFPDGQKVDIIGHIWTKDGDNTIGGELTERIGYKKIPQSIEGIGEVAQFVPYGPRKMGKDTEILAGSEWIVVLDRELKLNIEREY